MMKFIIGGLLVVAGVLVSTLVTQAIKKKNVEIKFLKTTPLQELKKLLTDNAEAGLTEYRQYVELKGVADAEQTEKAPYSEKDVAYYSANLYQVYEEAETYTDEKGTHQRMKRTESNVSSQKSYSPMLLKDPQTGELAVIRLSESGMQLDTAKTMDKFEPAAMMNQYSFFGLLNFGGTMRNGSKTLGYRMVEHTIGIEQPLYVLGEASLEGGRITVSKPSDRKKPFIVSIKNEDDLVRANESSSRFALFGGVALALIGVLIALFAQ